MREKLGEGFGCHSDRTRDLRLAKLGRVVLVVVTPRIVRALARSPVPGFIDRHAVYGWALGAVLGIVAASLHCARLLPWGL